MSITGGEAGERRRAGYSQDKRTTHREDGAEGLGKPSVNGFQDGGMTRYQVSLREEGHLTQLEQEQADLR